MEFQLNPEWHYRQIRRLARNNVAMDWLVNEQHLSGETISRFGLGLTPPGQGRHFTDALSFPVLNANGQFSGHYLYRSIPRVTTWTEGSQPRDSWGAQPVQLYFSGSIEAKSTILVVGQPMDVWSATTLVAKAPELAEHMLVVGATHGIASLDNAAVAKNPEFWRRWGRVIFALGSDESAADAIDSLLPYVAREVRCATIPEQFATETGEAAAWRDLLKKGTVDDLRAMLDDARPLTSSSFAASPSRDDIKELDPPNFFHNGHLYYSFERFVRGKEDDDGNIPEGFLPFVVKSDGAILEVVQSPRISNHGRRVLRLSDGTMISRLPTPLRACDASWEPDSILEFSKSKLENRPIIVPPLHELLYAIRGHLMGSVWLPNREDYTLLAFCLIASYAQEIFSAVPLILVTGPSNTGKSALSEEARNLGCNGIYLARTTVAGLMEAVDMGGGLTLADDLEEVGAGKKAGAAISTNEWQQVLKQSYKKASGTHTRMSNGHGLLTRKLYGVKIFNNTKGIDEITATRTFTVRSEKRTDASKAKMEAFSSRVLSPDQIRQLRNQIHIWVCLNVGQIDETYHRIMARNVERLDEIAAPLRTFALIAAAPELKEQLETVIARHGPRTHFDAEQAFADAIKFIVGQGFKCLSAPHVINEMSRILGPGWCQKNSDAGKIWHLSKFITERLISDEWVNPEALRPRICHEVKTRIHSYAVRPERIKDIADEIAKSGGTMPAVEKAAGSFCAGCGQCQYQTYCSILAQRNRE